MKWKICKVVANCNNFWLYMEVSSFPRSQGPNAVELELSWAVGFGKYLHSSPLHILHALNGSNTDSTLRAKKNLQRSQQTSSTHWRCLNQRIIYCYCWLFRIFRMRCHMMSPFEKFLVNSVRGTCSVCLDLISVCKLVNLSWIRIRAVFLSWGRIRAV